MSTNKLILCTIRLIISVTKFTSPKSKLQLKIDFQGFIIFIAIAQQPLPPFFFNPPPPNRELFYPTTSLQKQVEERTTMRTSNGWQCTAVYVRQFLSSDRNLSDRKFVFKPRQKHLHLTLFVCRSADLLVGPSVEIFFISQNFRRNALGVKHRK